MHACSFIVVCSADERPYLLVAIVETRGVSGPHARYYFYQLGKFNRMVVCAGWLTPNAHAQMHYASALGCPTDIKLMYNCVMY